MARNYDVKLFKREKLQFLMLVCHKRKQDKKWLLNTEVFRDALCEDLPVFLYVKLSHLIIIY